MAPPHSISFETLYSTKDPQALDQAEYFQPQLVRKVENGLQVFYVCEKHGWFDDKGKRVIDPISTLDPQEGFSSETEARVMYDKQVAHRASHGFVHSFSPDFSSPSGFYYRLVG